LSEEQSTQVMTPNEDNDGSQNQMND